MLFQNIFATAYLKFFFEEKLIANLMQKQETERWETEVRKHSQKKNWKYKYRIKFANEWFIKETPLKTVLKCRVSSTHRKISEELKWETEQ